jgi:hypothetical protein
MVAANQAFLMYSNVEKNGSLPPEGCVTGTGSFLCYDNNLSTPVSWSNQSFRHALPANHGESSPRVWNFLPCDCGRTPARFQRYFVFFPERVSEKIENEVEEALIYNEPTVEESPFFYPASSPHEKEPSRRESTPWCGRSST